MAAEESAAFDEARRQRLEHIRKIEQLTGEPSDYWRDRIEAAKPVWQPDEQTATALKVYVEKRQEFGEAEMALRANLRRQGIDVDRMFDSGEDILEWWAFGRGQW